MKPLTQLFFYTYAAAILTLAQTGWSADRVEYTITELKTPDGTALIPTKINDRGEVVGFAFDSNGLEHPFLYRNGVVQPLGLNGEAGYPFVLNNAGDILCWIHTNHTFYSVLITSNGSETRLSQVLGHEFQPVAMNDLGDILGYTISYDGYSTNLVYNYITGTIREFKDPAIVGDINNNGDVLGWSGFLTTILQGTNYVRFGVPGHLEEVESAVINNRGQVAGSMAAFPHKDFSGALEERPFIYADGHMTKLPCLPGDESAAPLDMNDAGVVVGASRRSAEDILSRAFVYKNHKLQDLDELMPVHPDWKLNAATSINSHGQIVGSGSSYENMVFFNYHGVILTPIPGKK